MKPAYRPVLNRRADRGEVLETLVPYLRRFLDSLFDPAALADLLPHQALPVWAGARPATPAEAAIFGEPLTARARCVLWLVAPLVLAACTRAMAIVVSQGARS